ncbi:hypothetical protein [Saccharopolyspora rectivirgula]|jgi:hypothetical protein|uniref:hypothetical protein n=1 Tax=Saccharopolyspora rectivirgula TaxID=28042 RepID=UPI0003F77FD6|nr:hypothetical protein [Saccharopolyspora rectivirgula]
MTGKPFAHRINLCSSGLPGLYPEDMQHIHRAELMAEARWQRRARLFTAGRWWRWLAEYAAERAERASAFRARGN